MHYSMVYVYIGCWYQKESKSPIEKASIFTFISNSV